jgi:ABC-type oligopeptide transport system substrate-binding subunit
MISSGAFQLSEWRNGELALVKNPQYYDAESVRLQELRLITISEPTTTINLYKAGLIDLVTPLLPALHLRLLRWATDFHTHPAIANRYLVMNTRNWPFDHVLVRYALNMAIDKKEIQRFTDAGPAALTLLPPLDGYEPPESLPIKVGDRTCDILAFDPSGARSLMSAAGLPEWSRLKIEYLYPTQGNHKERFEILQKQLRTSLGIELIPVPKESSIWNEETYGLHYRGISAWSDIGLCQDPTYFLDQFLTGAPANVTGWADSRYDAAVAEAKSSTEPAVRLRKFSNCERILLEAMPVIPLYFDAWQQLRKPFVRGIEGNSIDAIAFHRAWIDTNWRPQ